MIKSILSKRRKFIKQSALASATLILPTHILPHVFPSHNMSETDNINVSIFSKQLQFLDYKGMSESAKEMGFDGIDLTIRRKGHVLPERVVEDLPKATDAMISYGLKPNLFSTNVSDANDMIDSRVLETASQLGYKYYRTAWFKYKKIRMF